MSAVDLRLIADEVNDKAHRKEVNEIYSLARSTARDGKYSIYVKCSCEYVREKLTMLGFVVSRTSNASGKFTVYWKDDISRSETHG